MPLLLDTCVFIWWITNETSKISQKAFKTIEQSDTVYVSMVSAWEILIKLKNKKLSASINGKFNKRFFIEQLRINSFTPLLINMDHIFATQELESLHSDPFDRLLIAQSLADKLVLVTPDDEIKKYQVQTIW